jgi:hypothetical protein
LEGKGKGIGKGKEKLHKEKLENKTKRLSQWSGSSGRVPA